MADMVHLNGNKLCVIDVETTGLDPKIHEIIEVCVLYLDSFIRPVGLPFNVFLTPQRPETIDPKALKANGTNIMEVMRRGIDPFKAADLFEEWFGKLELPSNKKITPLGHNYHFDRGFLQEWLGPENYNGYFDYRIRDTMTVAHYLNDVADLKSEKYPFPKQGLTYLCSQLDVVNLSRHTALGDCLATAECYRKMLRPLTF
jgi:DNA polymerase-3 subunit epsilon